MRRRASVALLTAVLALAGACSEEGGDASTDPTSSAPADDATTTTEAADPSGPVPSPGCDAAEPMAPGVSEQTMTSGGQERRYQLSLPDDYDGTEPLPVVFALHALTVDYHFAASMAGFDDMPARYDFIGVAPSGLLDGPTPYWLAAEVDDNYDVEFIGDLLDSLEADLCIDEAAVYSTGMSNGGQMSSLVACTMPDRFTAVAPVAGVEFTDWCADGPVPVMAFHGDADPVVTYEGGGLNAEAISDIQFWKGDVPEGVQHHEGVDAAMANWAAHNGCDPEPTEERVAPSTRRIEWQGCEATTVLYVAEGAGHTWPGKPMPAFEASMGKGTTEIDASELIFEFFLGAPSD